jgi:hypothetical protein
MRQLGLNLYIGSILIVGTDLLLWGWTRPMTLHGTVPLSLVGFWFMLSLAAEAFWLQTRTRTGMISMSLAVNVATLFVLPPGLALTVTALSVGLADLLLHRRGLCKAAFNAAQMVISMMAALLVMYALSGSWAAQGSQAFLIGPFAVVSGLVVLFLANTFLVAGVISLSHGLSVWRAWRDNFGFGYQVLSSTTLSILGLTLVAATEVIGFMAGILYLLVFLFVRDGYHRHITEQERRDATPDESSLRPAADLPLPVE